MIKSSLPSGGEESLSRRGEGNIRTLGKKIKCGKREWGKNIKWGRGEGDLKILEENKDFKNGGGEEYVLIIHPLIFFIKKVHYLTHQSKIC